MKSNMQFNFIGICYPDDLSEHHNRPGEQLIPVAWYGLLSDELSDSECVNIVAQAVVDETICAGYDLDNALPDDAAQYKAELFEIVKSGLDGYNFRMDGVDNPEELIIYGYFSWQVPLSQT